MTINEAADILCWYLKKKGFIVQKYVAYSTNSIYIKLDYGVANTIRISDHKGKKHLAYRYNFLTTCADVSVKFTKDSLVQFYYGFDNGNDLVRDIMQTRNEKIDKFGLTNYKKYVHESYLKNKDNKGFWKKAKTL